MANALPFILAAGAAAVLLGKKKTSRGEPEHAPGSAATDEDEDAEDDAIDLAIQGIRVTPQQHTTLTNISAISAGQQPPPARVKKEEDDTKEPSANGCKVGTISPDKKYVCWGSPGATTKAMKVTMRRVPSYKEARNAAAAVAVGTLGGGGAALTGSPRIQFCLYCWARRKSLYHRKCIRRWKTGKAIPKGLRGKCRRSTWVRY